MAGLSDARFRSTAAAVLFVLAVAFGLSASASADVLLYRQRPLHTFGYESDTAFINDSGFLIGQLGSDRFALSQTRPVCRLLAFGFYGSSFDQFDEPPPATETMRARFYSDLSGLPGSVLYSATLTDPPRVATGFYISTGSGPPEYMYTLDLPGCFTAAAGTNYWLEISQSNDSQSRFRWENAAGGEFALQSPIGTPWRVFAGAQFSYELWTPEPASLCFFGMIFCAVTQRHGRSRR